MVQVDTAAMTGEVRDQSIIASLVFTLISPSFVGRVALQNIIAHPKKIPIK